MGAAATTKAWTAALGRYCDTRFVPDGFGFVSSRTGFQATWYIQDVETLVSVNGPGTQLSRYVRGREISGQCRGPDKMPMRMTEPVKSADPPAFRAARPCRRKRHSIGPTRSGDRALSPAQPARQGSAAGHRGSPSGCLL